MSFTDADYVRYDPFEGDRDVDIRCRTVKIVTVRKAHKCADPEQERPHKVKPGARARVERAIVDGEWGAYYVCLDCMDKWLTELGVKPIKARNSSFHVSPTTKGNAP